MMIATAGISSVARSYSAEMLSRLDASAVALGSKVDPSTVDKAKFPHYAAPQSSSNCAPYQGAKGASSGPWGIFAGKAVSSTGRCASFAKKNREEEEVSTFRTIGSNHAETRRTDFWPAIE